MTRRFIKKPLEIEAFRFSFDDEPVWFSKDKHVTYHPAMIGKDLDTLEITKIPSFCMIQTLEGAMRADVGDYIIKGIKGEIYPCKADIFEASYDEVPCAYVANVSASFDAKIWDNTPGILINGYDPAEEGCDITVETHYPL